MIINGTLIALILNSHATSGGTDFISMIISKKKGISVWNYIFMGNVAVLLIAGCIYGMNVALYSIIFQYASTQMINMMYKRYDKDTLFIITKKPDEVYNIILKKTNHDATLFKGVGCYKNEEKAMLYSVVNSDATRVLVRILKRKIRKHSLITLFKRYPREFLLPGRRLEEYFKLFVMTLYFLQENHGDKKKNKIIYFLLT